MHEICRPRAIRRWSLSAVVIALLSTYVIAAASISFAASDDEVGKLVTLTGDHQKQQFVAGERVDITKASVADDIFAAGRDLTFETVSAKHIVAMGMMLSLKGVTADELILLGGQMELSGNVKDDVVAAVCPFCPFGGRLLLTRTMQVGDDARLAGRDITVDGRIGGDLYAVARYFKLSGEIVGNAKIEAERIMLAPSARIGGDLLYAGPMKPEVADGAIISGQIRKVETDIPFAEGFPEHWIWYGVLVVLGVVLALVLLGAALQLAMPGLLSGAAATAAERPWASLGRGLVLALLVPAAVALLLATIVGAPIGLVTIAGFFLLLVLAFAAISYCIGLFVRGLFGRTVAPTGLGSKILWTATGILILIIVSRIPFLGWAIGVLAMIAGLGAVINQLGPLFRRTDAVPAAT